MRAILPAVLVAALAACQPAGQGSMGAAAPEAAPQAAILSPEELQGEYRLAGIDGEDLDLPEGIAVSITEAEIHVPGSCVIPGWRYRFEDGVLATDAIEGPTCRRAVLPHEQAIVTVFSGPGRVSRTPANGVLIEAGGSSLTLFSQ